MRREKRSTHRERRTDGVEDCDLGGSRAPGVRPDVSGWAVRPISLAAPVFKPAEAGTRAEVHPPWSECRCRYQGTGLLLPSEGVAGWGGKRRRRGQSGRSSRGSDAPPRSERKSRAGPRATGEGVPGRGGTEGVDLRVTHSVRWNISVSDKVVGTVLH